LAKALKYQMAFKTVDNKDVTVDFRVEGATGPVVELEAGVRPVVFREYNTEEDIFKPIRAFLCEIQIMTNVNGVTIDTFIANNDTDIQVIVHYNGYYGISTWYGYILQDDIEEVWDDGNHYLIVRAAEGFGLLKNIPFAVAGAEPIGKYTPLQFIENALSTLYSAGVTADYYVLNNLFHDSMLDTGGRHPLNQCYLDAKTFQQEATVYDDCYTVIEKICTAFGQSIFFDGQMWLFRPEELYISYNNNLRVANVTSVNQFEILTRYDIEIGVGREMQPIMPEMLRSLNRATKFDEVDFYYNGFDEMLQNETFARGALTSSSATTKTYNVDSWTFRRGTLDSTTAGTGTFAAREIYNSSLGGGLLERYIFMDLATPASTYQFVKSQSVAVPSLGIIKFTTDLKWANTITNDFVEVAWVILESGSTYYCLNEEGEWILALSLFAATASFIRLDISASSNVDMTTWNTIQVESNILPVAGNVTVYLGSRTTSSANIVYYKNMEFEYLSSFESGQDIRKILGINSYFNKTSTINNSFKKEIFLDDHFSALHKGAIFQSDQTTLTDADWYRYRFAGESYGFRRQNDTAHWEHNRFNRNKIDVNMYGISWDTGSGFELMNFKNTYRFMDDDVNKVYYPANISEIDLVNNTWSGTLVEVWDQTKDLPTTQSFEADFTLGTYTTATLTAPLTLVTSGGFSIQTSNTARYDAATTITTPVTVGIFGNVSCSTYPKNVTFELRKSGTAIRTITYPVYVANQPFTFDLSVGTQTIATNNTFTVVITGHSSVTIGGGDMKINTPGTAYTFDTYTDNYLYQ
jgi:hypothetical protein